MTTTDQHPVTVALSKQLEVATDINACFCIGCGQPDEPELHDPARCPAREGGKLDVLTVADALEVYDTSCDEEPDLDGDARALHCAIVATRLASVSSASVEPRKDTVAFVQDWLMNSDYDPTQFDKGFAAAIDARHGFDDAALTAIAERFCAAPLPDTVCADLVAIKPMAGRSGTNLMTVAEAKAVLRSIFPEPVPATNQAGYRPDVKRIMGKGKTDYRDNLAVALFEASHGMCLRVWSDATRDYWLKRADAALATQPATSQEGEAVEALAQFLHDEGGFGDAMTDRTWPDHADDTGQREGGWVKIVPSDVQAHFRNVARRWLGSRLAATPTPPTLSEDFQPHHVAAFLAGVRANPGGKNPVESYYSPNYPDDGTHEKPSWKIAEEAGLVFCNGSHKWTLTAEGNEALIRHEYAALACAQVKAS